MNSNAAYLCGTFSYHIHVSVATNSFMKYQSVILKMHAIRIYYIILTYFVICYKIFWQCVEWRRMHRYVCCILQGEKCMVLLLVPFICYGTCYAILFIYCHSAVNCSIVWKYSRLKTKSWTVRRANMWISSYKKYVENSHVYWQLWTGMVLTHFGLWNYKQLKTYLPGVYQIE